MPELPEVETVRRGLEQLVGSHITSVEVFRERSIRAQVGGESAFVSGLTGAEIAASVRRGKFLWLPLRKDQGDETGPVAPMALVAHLGMSGQLLVREGDEPQDHAHLRITLTLEGERGSQRLDFIDQRTFGHLHTATLVPTPDGLPGGHGSKAALLPETATHIARDLLDPALEPGQPGHELLVERLARTKQAIKPALLHQGIVSGVGNIYVDEALWMARVHPAAPSSTLSRAQTELVLAAATQVMRVSLEHGGTSFDALYVDTAGNAGEFAGKLQAYGRVGEPCLRCGHPLERLVIGGRGTSYCPICQGATPQVG